MKPTILYDSKVADINSKKKTVNIQITSPRDNIYTLFGKGLEHLAGKKTVKLQVCIAADPDSIEDCAYIDENYVDVIMFGQHVELEPNNTLVNLDMTGHYRLVIPKHPKDKHVVIGVY